MSIEMGDSRLRISQLAAQVGMAPSALRYYEQAGLLSEVGRSPAGYRLYGPEVEGRIRFIQRAGALGLKLVEIRRLIDSAPRDPQMERSILHSAIVSKIDETRATLSLLQSRDTELKRLEARLRVLPATNGCHLGDCICWLPG